MLDTVTPEGASSTAAKEMEPASTFTISVTPGLEMTTFGSSETSPRNTRAIQYCRNCCSDTF